MIGWLVENEYGRFGGERFAEEGPALHSPGEGVEGRLEVELQVFGEKFDAMFHAPLKVGIEVGMRLAFLQLNEGFSFFAEAAGDRFVDRAAQVFRDFLGKGSGGRSCRERVGR